MLTLTSIAITLFAFIPVAILLSPTEESYVFHNLIRPFAHSQQSFLKKPTLGTLVVPNKSGMVLDVDSRQQLKDWLNKPIRVKITDGRILIGKFCCTDKDANVIIGQCEEYMPEGISMEPRNLGLAMIPGRHIMSLSIQEHRPEDIS